MDGKIKVTATLKEVLPTTALSIKNVENVLRTKNLSGLCRKEIAVHRPFYSVKAYLLVFYT